MTKRIVRERPRFGPTLKKLRLRYSLSAAALGKRIKTDGRIIRRWETGENLPTMTMATYLIRRMYMRDFENKQLYTAYISECLLRKQKRFGQFQQILKQLPKEEREDMVREG